MWYLGRKSHVWSLSLILCCSWGFCRFNDKFRAELNITSTSRANFWQTTCQSPCWNRTCFILWTALFRRCQESVILLVRALWIWQKFHCSSCLLRIRTLKWELVVLLAVLRRDAGSFFSLDLVFLRFFYFDWRCSIAEWFKICDMSRHFGEKMFLGSFIFNWINEC